MLFFYVSRRYAFGIRAGRAAIAVGDTPRENEKAGRIGAHAPIARPKAPRIGLRPIAVFHKTKLFHECDTGIAVARMTGFGAATRGREGRTARDCLGILEIVVAIEFATIRTV